MSQPLPSITIADLLTGTRIGMLVGRITNIEMFTAVNKFSKPLPNQVVNVYKLTLIDNSGTIVYADWCKKPESIRIYEVNQVLRFEHAKLKVSITIDPNTGAVYPPTVTSEQGKKIELLDKDMKAVIPRFGNTPVSAPAAVPAVASLPIASSPVAQVIPVPQSTPATEWLNVKAQFPNFYNAVDELFGEIWKALGNQPAITQDLETRFKWYMDIIWGA